MPCEDAAAGKAEKRHHNSGSYPFTIESFLVVLSMEQNAKGTKQLLQELITQRGWWKEIGLTEDQGNNYRTRFKSGKMTIDKMEEILVKAGYKVFQEKLWFK